MAHFSIRFNNTRGRPGRGTADHVWRVFADGKEYLFKHLRIESPVYDERTGDDWNVACDGHLTIDRDTSTAIIRSDP